MKRNYWGMFLALVLGAGAPLDVFAREIVREVPKTEAGHTALTRSSSGLTSGVEISSQRMSLAQLESAALSNHPTILAYCEKINALGGQWEQAGLGPNPEIGYGWEEFSEDGPGGKQKVEISQEFLGGSQLYHAQGVVSRQIETARHELEMAKLRVITDVRVAAYEYLALMNKLQHLQAIARNDAELAKRIQVGYENQNDSKLDWVQARIAARKSRQQVLEAENDLLAAWGRLACLLGNPELEPCRLSIDLDQIPEQKTWEYYSQVLLENSPEIARARAKVEEAQKKIQYEHSKNSMNVTVSGAMVFNTKEDIMEGALGVSMPLRVRDRNQGNISSARSEAIQAQKDLERISLNLQHRLAEVYGDYANAKKDLDIYRDELLPEAREALSLARTSYENRESTILDLVYAQRIFREANIEYFDALCQYWTTLTILEGQLLTGALDDSSF